MKCDEAADYVSALCDGERIPREAAEHVGSCKECQARMTDYLEMGAELRRVASLEPQVEAKPRVWVKQQDVQTIWWQKGWQKMSIPRLVFAMLLAAVVGLGSSLAIVKVKAHEDGTVMMFKLAAPGVDPIPCPVSTVDSKYNLCSGVASINGGSLIYEVKLLSTDRNRLALRVRTKFSASGPASTLNERDAVPQKQYWFESGQTLPVDVSGLGVINITGEWTDHIPTLLTDNHDLDPEAGEFRMVSPLLLKGKEVVGDMQGGSAIGDKPEDEIFIYFPGQGRLDLSLLPMNGATRGEAKLNRVTFKINEESYTLLTGTPITRNPEVWVRLQADYKPKGESAGAFIGASDRSHDESDAVNSQVR